MEEGRGGGGAGMGGGPMELEGGEEVEEDRDGGEGAGEGGGLTVWGGGEEGGVGGSDGRGGGEGRRDRLGRRRGSGEDKGLLFVVKREVVVVVVRLHRIIAVLGRPHDGR